MGLHLNWELRLPASASTDDVRAVLAKLHDAAAAQQFEEVSPLLPAGTRDGRRWWTTLHYWASLIAEPYPEDTPPLRGDPSTVQGFIVQPGEGCETAFFALMRRSDDNDTRREWSWHCSCKTQYASVASDEHLIQCHSSLVNVLDCAVEIGIDVVVRDETHYWDTRDTSRLLREVHK